MRTGFKASNWRWNRKADIRDKVDRLTLEFYSVIAFVSMMIS